MHDSIAHLLPCSDVNRSYGLGNGRMSYNVVAASWFFDPIRPVLGQLLHVADRFIHTYQSPLVRNQAK